ncbi:S24/S26 family peptidase [bacterium]|nr:S24/S26 family peptidase [bacterium]
MERDSKIQNRIRRKIEISQLFKMSLQKGFSFTVKGEGDSMWPFIRSNSDIRVSFTSFKKIESGDIILVCTDKGENIIHRVLYKYEKYIFIKGDIHKYPDNFIVTENNYIGKVKLPLSNIYYTFYRLLGRYIIPTLFKLNKKRKH